MSDPKKYTGLTCKGSIALGTACYRCEKCRDEERKFDGPVDPAVEMRARLADIPTEMLKEEIVRRRDVDRAKRHIKSAEDALVRAQEKLKSYQAILKADRDAAK